MINNEHIEVPKSLLAVLKGQKTRHRPIWLMRQAGRYLPEYRELRRQAANFLSFCLTPELAIEATMQPIRRFEFDASILFSDILVVPHGIGRQVSFIEGEGPKLVPLSVAESLPVFDAEDFDRRVGNVYQTVAGLKSALPTATTLIGFAGSPWTVASYMIEGGSSRDFAAIKRAAYGAPEWLRLVLDRLIAATIHYLEQQIAHGAEVIQLFESWAAAVPADLFEACVIEPNRRIIAALKLKYPAVPVMVFPRGAGIHYQGLAALIGADAISLDPYLPLEFIAALQNETIVQGNLDPIALVAGGDALTRAIMPLLEKLDPARHIVNLGHGIVPQTPIAHVEHLLRLVRT